MTTPAISAADRAALKDSVFALHGEHREDWGPAMAWLIDHPDVARPAMVEMVEQAKERQVDMAADRAALVLGEIGAPEDVDVLARGLMRGGEQFLARRYARALAKHRAPEALQALQAATLVEDQETVRVAALALGDRGDEGGRPALEALLDHAVREVRYAAVQALIDLGPARSRTALQRRQRAERDKDVRDAIRKALAKR